MKKELLINRTLAETRVALLEDGLLQDLFIERVAERSVVGNVYLGKVERVLPGMEAAFINIGTDRSAFIHVSDIGPRRPADKTASASIQSRLHEGQKIVVQVTREPVGSKGARLTTELTLPSRYLVLVPGDSNRGVSHQISDSAQRDRLLDILDQALRAEPMDADNGFIIRTVAEDVGVEAFSADLHFLSRLWSAVQRRAKTATKPCLLYEDLALAQRILRDVARPDFSRILIDDRSLFESLKQFSKDYTPRLTELLEHHDEQRAVFDYHGVELDIQRALGREVPLKCGGNLVFDQGEAMTTVDVNTGSYVKGRNLEDTVFTTNLEAAAALARQLRLRNLGGIIVIDFIDMHDPEHQREVLRAFERAMSSDSTRYRISGLSDLGLVEMTRQRSRDSLEHMLCDPCPSCDGRGLLKSVATVCYEIYREILRNGFTAKKTSITVLASQAVADNLLGEESSNVADLERRTGKAIRCKAEPGYGQEQFDIVLL